MSYAGHVFDMINRFKQNRSMLKSKKQKELYKENFISSSNTHKFKNNKQLSEQKRKEIIQRIQVENIKERKKKLLSLIISFIIIVLLLYYLNRLLNHLNIL